VEVKSLLRVRVLLDFLPEPQREPRSGHILGTATRVESLLADWRRQGLVFIEGDRAVHVATDHENQLLCRIRRESEKTGGPELALELAQEPTCVKIP
jgi:hypothetical protein